MPGISFSAQAIAWPDESEKRRRIASTGKSHQWTITPMPDAWRLPVGRLPANWGRNPAWLALGEEAMLTDKPKEAHALAL